MKELIEKAEKLGFEEWRDIPNYEGLYQVSNKGNVKSLEREVEHSRKGTQLVKERILSLCNSNNGYKSVVLCKDKKAKTIKVHSLVAMAFLGHKPNKYNSVIDHIDNDGSNNNLENLRIVSHRENISKDMKKGFSKYRGVHWCKVNKKWISRIMIEGKRKHLGKFGIVTGKQFLNSLNYY